MTDCLSRLHFDTIEAIHQEQCGLCKHTNQHPWSRRSSLVLSPGAKSSAINWYMAFTFHTIQNLASIAGETGYRSV